MNPLVGLAISLVPELLKLIQSQKNNTQLAQKVSETVENVTAESKPENASKKIYDDPDIQSKLKIRLAEIAVEAQRAAMEDAARERESALKEAELANKNTEGARENLRDLIRDSPLLSWTPAILSYVVVAGFLLTLGVLGYGIAYFKKEEHDQTILQIFNLLVGALAAAFATVLNFWLGSSLGSRSKDTALDIRTHETQVRAEQAAAASQAQPQKPDGTATPSTVPSEEQKPPQPQPQSEPETPAQTETTPAPTKPTPAPPGILKEVLPALMTPHRHFPSGASWALTPQGIAIDGASAKGSMGEPSTVRRIWRDFGPLIAAAAAKHGVPVELIVATIATESSGNPNAQRTEAAIHDESVGLMQTLVTTARHATGNSALSGSALRDPATSIDAGTAYIAQQRGSTHFDPPLVAAAYNAGSLRPEDAGANRWKLVVFPRGTGRHIDKFVEWFCDCMRVAAADQWVTSGKSPSFALEIGGGSAGAPSVPQAPLAPQAPAPRSTPRADPGWPPRPSFPPLRTDADKQRLFGTFTYKASPTPDNPERIDIEDAWEQANIVKVTIELKTVFGKSGPLQMQFHRLGADQLVALWQEWEKQGLLNRVLTFDGSYVPRFIRGSTSVLSNHAFGTAFDINAKWNPLRATPALLNHQGCTRELVEIANNHGFYWGGHFASRPDGMHFEVAKLI